MRKARNSLWRRAGKQLAERAVSTQLTSLPQLPALANLDPFTKFVNRARARNWPFTADQIEVLRRTMPTEKVSNITSVLTLDIWLGDIETTFEELCKWVEDTHNRVDRDTLLISGELRLDDEFIRGNKPRVRWVIVDLSAQRDTDPNDIPVVNSPAMAVLTAAALYPDWADAIDHNIVPSVWLQGLEVCFSRNSAWKLFLSNRGRYGHLYISGATCVFDHEQSGFAVPTIEEVQPYQMLGK